MATVARNCVSFETGGLEEADVFTQGTPEIGTTSPSPKQGTYRLGLLGATTVDQFRFLARPDGAAVAAWSNTGFWIQVNNTTPTSAHVFFEIRNATSNIIAQLRLATSGDVEILDSNGDLGATATTPFIVNTWHRMELIIFANSSGQAELFVGGSSVATDALGDYNPGVGGVGTEDYMFQGGSTSGENIYIDSFYIRDSNDEPTILGDFEVRAYGPAGGTGFTTKGTAPATGAWANTDEIPFNDSNEAEWTGSSDSFSAVADGDDKNGPSGDTGIGTIHGAKYIGRWDRDGGGATTHFMRFGNDVDTPLGETVDLGLTTTITNFLVFTTAAGEVPLSTENFEFGGRISGAQDMHLYDQMAFLLFTPAVAGHATPKVDAIRVASKVYQGLAH